MRKFVVPIAMFVAALAAAPAEAALLRLTPQGLSPSEYNDLGLPTDPAEIPSDGFRLTYHGGGMDQLVNPVMLILAIPDLSLDAPSISVSATSGFTSVGVDLGDSQNSRYGGDWDSGGFAGTFSNTTVSKVYEFIGFTPSGSSSENYSNWNGATGLTSWNLFVYAITFDPLMEHGNYVEFDTSLPTGSYVIGYGCEDVYTTGPKTGLCSGSGDTESTPFTFAGLVTHQVPEPSSMSLLFLGVGALLVRTRKSKQAA